MSIKTATKSLTALQSQIVRVNCTLLDDLTTDDYGVITLTLREDPKYPRNRSQIENLPFENPRDWPLIDSFVGEWEGSGTTCVFEVTPPDEPGKQRYVIDVVADEGTAGRVELVPVTWVTVEPTLK